MTMKFHNPAAEVFVPEGAPVDAALSRTTHLGIAAHQDDLEIMAYHGVLECFGQPDKHFTGVTVTNGAGSPRDGLYARYTDAEMQKVRRAEQKKAAILGEYSAHVFLDYPSAPVKDPANADVIEDLKQLLRAAKPRGVYTHNLADKHDTHVATALRVVRALRELPQEARPGKLYGCEVWRALDWMNDEDKVVFNVEAHENLAAALLGVFDSQICGGKRYDLATMGRRRANATYLAAHGVDESTSINFGMDMTPLLENEQLEVGQYVKTFIDRFAAEVSHRLAKLV
jgi:LmbE family N-acetylglucosaminyl deacetylase